MQMYMTGTDRVLCAEYRSGDGKGVKKKKRTRIKKADQVNKYSDRTPLSSPLPSGEAMVAGWALFSARRYFLRWRAWSTQKKHALIDQCVQLVNHLTVPRDDTKQTTTAATFFHLYSEGGLRLPVFGLLV